MKQTLEFFFVIAENDRFPVVVDLDTYYIGIAYTLYTSFLDVVKCEPTPVIDIQNVNLTIDFAPMFVSFLLLMFREEDIPALQPALQPAQPVDPIPPQQDQQGQQGQQDQQGQHNHMEDEEVKSHFNGVGRSLGGTAPSSKRSMTDRERRLAFFQRKQ